MIKLVKNEILQAAHPADCDADAVHVVSCATEMFWPHFLLVLNVLVIGHSVH